MKRVFFFLAILFFATVEQAQNVTADIQVTEEGSPVPFGVVVTCDGLDSLFVVEPDSTGHFRMVVPRGLCMITGVLQDCGDIYLDLQRDTSILLNLTFLPWPPQRDLYRSRREKDSTLHAREAALKRDLDGMDTNCWPYHPNYVTLAQEMEDDLFYRLPRWRTYSPDTVLHYMKLCYMRAPEEYEYYYYTIRQMEYRLGLEPDRRVREPRKPDGRWYVPAPEVPDGWVEDTVTNYGGIFEHAWSRSGYIKNDFGPQGEPSLAYPRRKKPAVRMLVYGGLSNSTALRVEDGRFYYCSTDKPWEIEEAHYRERWSVKLTKGELDTLWRCVDTLLTAGDSSFLNANYAIDAPIIVIEYSDANGYRQYTCGIPEKHPLSAPLAKYLDTLWRRNVCQLVVPIYDADSGVEISWGHLILDSRNYHHDGGTGYIGGLPRVFVPKGKYTLRVKCIGYESYEQEINVKGDMTLEAIRLRKVKGER